MQKGTISVQSENIFPIIKQFLYSDREIFLRELMANAIDATTKLQALASKGEFQGELGDLSIEVIINKKAKTLTIRDKGIGMTEEEVGKYLNQIAISSAQEFVEKYKSESNIIGKFGLGFYSAFMVANRVDVDTQSWNEGEAPIRWSCEGDPSYKIINSKKTSRGTDVILNISGDCEEFLDEYRISELLNKYCKFLPIPIKFGTKKETIEEEKGSKKKTKVKEVDNIINNTSPAWKRSTSELADEDYFRFYEELYPASFQKPLFYIHLNIDYPFNMTGILYFPKLNNSLEIQKNKIQLYCNQVYVTDDVKEVVPEFLTLLHGVIDSPDIPLNVSRSYLQSDSNVRKITGYITKKVAEKLHDLFRKDRKAFEEKWQDLGVFIKYGMMSDEKFHEKALEFLLLQNVDGEFFTLDEYKGKVKAIQTDKNERIVLLYTNDKEEHHGLIEAAKTKGYDLLLMNTIIDSHFLQHLEYHDKDITFTRVDAEALDKLIDKEAEQESVLSEKEKEVVSKVFEELSKEIKGASVVLSAQSPDNFPVQVTKPEFLRRMREMHTLTGGAGMSPFDEMYNIVVNTNHPLIAKKLTGITEEAKQREFASQLLNLALLNQGLLKGAKLNEFVNKNLERLGEQ